MEFLADSRARAYGTPMTTGVVRQRVSDFRVDECLGFEASGDGEHVLLQVEKIACNTVDVARMLAMYAGSPLRDVGYSGLKDKHAACTQWFTVHCSAKIPWEALERPGIRILKAARHHRKLKRGSHRANRFRIRIDIDRLDRPDLDDHLDQVRRGGVPNYFGEQRFGRCYADNVRRLLAGKRVTRTDRSMTLSAIRSDLFNRVLDRRVRERSWNVALRGEYVNLDGSRSGFVAQDNDPDVASRIDALDLHPTAPLCGAGLNPAGREVAIMEEDALREHQDLRDLLVCEGLKMERRPTRCMVRDLEWCVDVVNSMLEVRFILGRGQYATSVLREILDYKDVTRTGDPFQHGSARSERAGGAVDI